MEEIREVGVQDVLRARDERCARQQELLNRHGAPVISFTMNIAGPVKTDGLIRRAFFEGCAQIEAALAAGRMCILEQVQTLDFTGNEMIWAADAPAAELKKRMLAIEETHPLGRLFDIDVLDAGGRKLARTVQRRCLICGSEVHACARSRAHTARELYLRARELIRDFFDEEYARFIGMCAERALLCEAVTTPKPGLVDCADSGAHWDMDLFSFVSSASTLRSWFEQSARIGMRMRNADAADVFQKLRMEGIQAERAMLHATGGVNTHKGALFSLGILCCAAGMAGEDAKTGEILECAARIAGPSLVDFSGLSAETARTGGEKQYIEGGLTGIRGEAAAGFPSVKNLALPALRRALEQGKSLNDAGLDALVALMAHVQDSNILRRRGSQGLKTAQARAKALMEKGFGCAELRNMNEEFVRENISPGGSADLLAAAYMMHFIENTTGGKQA